MNTQITLGDVLSFLQERYDKQDYTTINEINYVSWKYKRDLYEKIPGIAKNNK